MIDKSTKTPELLLAAIDSRLKVEVAKMVEKMKVELEEKTPEIIASVIIEVMAMADMQVMQDRVVFTIKYK